MDEKVKVEAKVKETGGKITRREFLGFFLFGGLLSLFSKKIKPVVQEKSKKAMFWRKKDEV